MTRPGDEPSSTFALPAGLTLAGRQAFDGAVQEYARKLVEHLAQQSNRRELELVHTTQDVRAARLAYEREIRRLQDGPGAGVRGFAVVLLLLAVALGVLTPYAAGFLQATLLGLFVGAETAGLLLLRQSCRRTSGRR